MSWIQHNLEKINNLNIKGVDTGIAKNTVKHDINRNYTLEGELTSCEILLKSFDPKINKIKILQPKDESLKIDININDIYLFQVKRLLFPEIMLIIDSMHRFYHGIMLEENRFIQAIITYNPKSKIDTYKEGYPKITKTDGIIGVEILIELDMFKERISKKILSVFDRIKKKDAVIPIIDVRNFPIHDFQYIKNEIHKHYSKTGYIILFLTYEYPLNKELTPIFYPISYPQNKYKKILEKLKKSLSNNPVVNSHSYSFFHKKEYFKGLNDIQQRDKEGYIIIDGKQICQSLTFDKNINMTGFIIKDKIISEIIVDVNGSETSSDVEYLKLPRKKN